MTKMLAVVPGDKDSCVIIMKTADSIAKMETMIDQGITCDFYTAITKRPQRTSFPNFLYRNIKELKAFPELLCRKLKDHLKYEKILLTSNQPLGLYVIAKRYKFAS